MCLVVRYNSFDAAPRRQLMAAPELFPRPAAHPPGVGCPQEAHGGLTSACLRCRFVGLLLLLLLVRVASPDPFYDRIPDACPVSKVSLTLRSGPPLLQVSPALMGAPKLRFRKLDPVGMTSFCSSSFKAFPQRASGRAIRCHARLICQKLVRCTAVLARDVCERLAAFVNGVSALDAGGGLCTLERSGPQFA